MCPGEIKSDWANAAIVVAVRERYRRYLLPRSWMHREAEAMDPLFARSIDFARVSARFKAADAKRMRLRVVLLLFLYRVRRYFILLSTVKDCQWNCLQQTKIVYHAFQRFGGANVNLTRLEQFGKIMKSTSRDQASRAFVDRNVQREVGSDGAGCGGLFVCSMDVCAVAISLPGDRCRGSIDPDRQIRRGAIGGLDFHGLAARWFYAASRATAPESFRSLEIWFHARRIHNILSGRAHNSITLTGQSMENGAVDLCTVSWGKWSPESRS